MSWTGLCSTCSEAALTQNVEDLRSHSGEGFERWRRGMAACVGLTLPPLDRERGSALDSAA